MITRSEALEMLADNGVCGALLEHSLASEAVLCKMAERLNENTHIWSLAALLHDLDYPHTAKMPAEHGLLASELLADKLPEIALQAIRAHNGEMNGHLPATIFDFALRAGESVTGLISASAKMRPSGMEGMEIKSIKKKMKDKAFAASVSRENIRECEKAGLALDDFLALAIQAMSEQQASSGLHK